MQFIILSITLLWKKLLSVTGVVAGCRCDSYQKLQSADVSRTQHVLSEASGRLLSEFALRHGIVGILTVLTVFGFLIY